MGRRTTPVVLLVAVLMLHAPVAHAKGPAGATIEGDGIEGSVLVEQPGELGQGTAMSRLVEAVGFFELTFGKSPQVSAQAPTTALGKARWVITWDMSAGDTIVQEIYPDAAGGPVTHISPGQQFWEDTTGTVGGWFTITDDIAAPLVDLGVAEAAVARLIKAASPISKSSDELTPATVAEGVASTKKSEPTPGADVPLKTEVGVGSNPAGLDAALLAAVLVLIATIIGGAAWMRRRRPMLQ